jgi:protease-4
VNFQKKGDDGKIDIIYAQGDIVDGKGEKEQIGSDDFVPMIRKARLDDDVDAIVFRVNSPGGSALASEAIWREISLAKKSKAGCCKYGRLCCFRRILYLLRSRFCFCR